MQHHRRTNEIAADYSGIMSSLTGWDEVAPTASSRLDTRIKRGNSGPGPPARPMNPRPPSAAARAQLSAGTYRNMGIGLHIKRSRMSDAQRTDAKRPQGRQARAGSLFDLVSK
jgi:hypothetical protein